MLKRKSLRHPKDVWPLRRTLTKSVRRKRRFLLLRILQYVRTDILQSESVTKPEFRMGFIRVPDTSVKSPGAPGLINPTAWRTIGIWNSEYIPSSKIFLSEVVRLTLTSTERVHVINSGSWSSDIQSDHHEPTARKYWLENVPDSESGTFSTIINLRKH